MLAAFACAVLSLGQLCSQCVQRLAGAALSAAALPGTGFAPLPCDLTAQWTSERCSRQRC